MIITAYNPTVDGLEKTYLALSYNLGATSIQVRSNLQFSANQRILLGEPGLASSEVVTTGTVAADGVTIAISATLYPHEADTPVYLLQFDQAKFYRSTTGINGPYSLLANNPVNLDFTSADLETTYNDLTAQAGYYYKITVYNSITGVESAFSDAIPFSGWGRNTVGYVINSMYEELSDATEDNFSRDEVIGYMNEVNDDLIAQVVRPYNFLYTRKVFSRISGDNTLSWPTDDSGNNAMWKFDHIDYNFIDNTTNPVTNMTYTVPVVDLEYFRNRYTANSNNLSVPSNITATLTSGGSLTVGDTYFYEITATYSNGGESGPSVEVSQQVVLNSQQITLAWNAISGVTGYNIYRGLSSGGETLLTSVSASSTSFIDNGNYTPGTQVPPNNTMNDMVQEIALDESQQTFNYYPASLTSSTSVWYLYYYTFFNTLSSEGDTLQTPTPKVYKHYIAYKYYLKKSVAEPDYVQIANIHYRDYTRELLRLKGQDRRDVGTPRSFHNAGWANKSFQRYV